MIVVHLWLFLLQQVLEEGCKLHKITSHIFTFITYRRSEWSSEGSRKQFSTLAKIKLEHWISCFIFACRSQKALAVNFNQAKVMNVTTILVKINTGFLKLYAHILTLRDEAIQCTDLGLWVKSAQVYFQFSAFCVVFLNIATIDCIYQ